MKKDILYIFSLLMLFSCIEPFEQQFEEKSNYLVVEGAITSEPGPYMVRLTSTRNILDETNAFKLRVNDAQVSIAQSGGKTVLLYELDTTGTYFTPPDFRAEAGKSYTLSVVLVDGKTYSSDTVELPATPRIDSIGVTYGAERFVSELNSSLSRTGFFIDAYVNDPEEQQNNYLIDWDYTYQIRTSFEATSPQDCCATCWVLHEAPGFGVFSDQIVNGNAAAEFPLFFLPVIGKMLYNKIYVVAKVRSLDEEAYRFWKTVSDAKNSQGGIFDPTPSTIRSNVKNVADESELVLGYFYAASVDSVTRFIYPRDFPERIDYTTGFAGTCTLLPNTTSVEPDYWNE